MRSLLLVQAPYTETLLTTTLPTPSNLGLQEDYETLEVILVQYSAENYSTSLGSSTFFRYGDATFCRI